MPDHNPPFTSNASANRTSKAVTALYNDPAVTRQVLQMPFQSTEVWRQRLLADNERALKLVALHQGVVIGHLGWKLFADSPQPCGQFRHGGRGGMAGQGCGFEAVGGGAGCR
jgi:putative acetyltransferase